MGLSLKKRKNTQIEETSSKKSKGQFILFIGDEGAILSYLDNGEVTRRLFSSSAEDKATETLSALLKEFSAAPIYVMVDMVDQSYVRHTLPPVTPLGVNKIIQRRLNRDFSADDIKGSISLGREKSGRKDWNFLLIALSMSESLSGWCDLLYNLPNRFMGIYLAPVESELVINKLNQMISSHDGVDMPSKKKKKKRERGKKKTEEEAQPTHANWDILVVHNKTGGFRQVVLKNNKLVFTRMAQTTDDVNATVIAGNVEQEVKNTIEYLKRLSFTNNSTLNISIIIGEEIKTHISPDTFTGSVVRIMTPYEAAELLGVQKSVLSGDRYADVLLSAAFATSKKKKLRLSTDHITKTENYLHTQIG